MCPNEVVNNWNLQVVIGQTTRNMVAGIVLVPLGQFALDSPICDELQRPISSSPQYNGHTDEAGPALAVLSSAREHSRRELGPKPTLRLDVCHPLQRCSPRRRGRAARGGPTVLQPNVSRALPARARCRHARLRPRELSSSSWRDGDGASDSVSLMIYSAGSSVVDARGNERCRHSYTDISESGEFALLTPSPACGSGLKDESITELSRTCACALAALAPGRAARINR